MRRAGDTAKGSVPRKHSNTNGTATGPGCDVCAIPRPSLPDAWPATRAIESNSTTPTMRISPTGPTRSAGRATWRGITGNAHRQLQRRPSSEVSESDRGRVHPSESLGERQERSPAGDQREHRGTGRAGCDGDSRSATRNQESSTLDQGFFMGRQTCAIRLWQLDSFRYERDQEYSSRDMPSVWMRQPRGQGGPSSMTMEDTRYGV